MPYRNQRLVEQNRPVLTAEIRRLIHVWNAYITQMSGAFLNTSYINYYRQVSNISRSLVGN